MTNTRRGEVECGRRAERACADAQHLRLEQALLASDAEFG
jgi:hypothetical protein